ncbi:hypothetical protein BGZ58_007716 [Dissophora ornata]|nr:hypothetical protein BGZ58_007716 [Dissophora ornata]
MSSGLGTSNRNTFAGVIVPDDTKMLRKSAGSDCKIVVVESAIGEGTGSSLSNIETAKCEGGAINDENGAGVAGSSRVAVSVTKAVGCSDGWVYAEDNEGIGSGASVVPEAVSKDRFDNVAKEGELRCCNDEDANFCSEGDSAVEFGVVGFNNELP